jgi:tRNA pseudouridine38-40 synthase
MRYKLTLEYDGTDFHGWQVQARERTVQGVLEDAVARLFGEPVRVASAGRTDAGVHARGQVAAFSVQRERPLDTVLSGLNALTPADVAVRSAETADENFDPRRDARRRRYCYRIWNTRWASPFWRRYSWHVVRPLDTERMAVGAAQLLGTYDFTSFRAADCDAEHPIRTISRSEIERDDCMILYTVEANAFLRHMVRNLIGTLVEVGLGERPGESIAGLIEKRDRNLAGATAPAAGLCLERVWYSED